MRATKRRATSPHALAFWTSTRRWALALTATIAFGTYSMAQNPAPGPVAPAKVLIADVIPVGNKNVPTQKIMSLIQTRAGGEYNRLTLNDDVRRLYQTRSFADVDISEQPTTDGRVNVYLLLKELPSLVQEVTYPGAKHFKPDELETITGIRKGTQLNPIANKLACQSIVRRYQEKGRMLASCTLEKGGEPGDTNVVFNITEGPVAKISGIDFEGNEFVSDGRLMTQVNTSKKFFGLFGGTYNPMMTDMDVNKLEDYYRSNGYHDCRVSRELVWDEESRNAKLIFHIDEGKRYKVAGVDIHGNNKLPREELLKLVKVKEGDVYNKGTVERDIATLKDKYGYLGYGVPVIERVTYNEERPGELIINYEITERPPATVGQIHVVGNNVTKMNVIMRQLPFYPGQVLTYPDLRLAERNLARLNIFEVGADGAARPTVTVLDPDTDNPVKDILVSVQETTTGSLMFGVGVNSDAGFNGSIVLNERNFDILRWPTSFEDLLSGHAFRGAGQELRMEMVPGTQLQRYTASIREPFLFDSAFSLTVGGYYFDRIYNEYRESRLGSRVTVGRKLSQYWNSSASLRVENVGIHDVPFFAPPTFQDAQGDNFVLGMRGGVSRDTRDSYLRPTEGSLTDFSVEQVLGTFQFPVASIEFNKYFTTYQRADQSGKHVLALRSQASFAGNDAPVFERFYAGGFRTMRGFEFRGVGPDTAGFKTGGDFMFLNSLEYQIPVRANDQLYFVGFVDTGTVETDIEITSYRVAAGVGARIIVPMMGPVPIAIDFGFPIVKAASDREQIFSFWVGFFH